MNKSSYSPAAIKKIYSKTYLKLINKLGQYELVSFNAAWDCQYIRHCPVDWGLLLVAHAFQVAVKTRVTW